MDRRSMTHEEIQDLIPAYALGALDTEEAAVLLEHLQACDSCPRLLAEYREAVEVLPSLVPEAAPPQSLKRRIMARLEPAPQGTGLAGRPGGLNWSRLALAWAPLSFILLLALLTINISLANRLGQQAPEVVSNQAVTVALEGTDVASEANGTMVAFPQSGMAMLAVRNMPPLSEGWVYQLWLIRDGERLSGGTFVLDEEGRGYLLVEVDLSLYQSIGITVEPEGGSPAPTGDRYMFGNL